MQGGSPYFSIILPAYNRADIIGIPIQSVLKQNFTDWELIIIDDGSTDNTKEKISKYLKDERIKYFYQPNSERSNARNSGIINSKGKYICFLDSDDEYLDDHLQVFHDNILNQQEGLWFTKTLIRMKNGGLNIKPVPSIKSMDKFAFLLHYTFTPINACISRSILESYNFDERLNYSEDLDLWLRIAASGNDIYEINAATAIYNAQEDMFAKNAKNYLNSYRIIFSKKEMKGLLPVNKKKMLLSKCYYFLSIIYQNEKSFFKMYFSIIKSFILFPKGYNNRTNKIMLVMFLYNIPVIGKIIKFLKAKISN